MLLQSLNFLSICTSVCPLNRHGKLFQKYVQVHGLPYLVKILIRWGIKFGDLVVCLSTTMQLKSENLYVHTAYLPILFNTSFGAKPPNLMIANTSD